MRRPSGLVVGDDQLAVVVELEPVDDAAQREVADLRLEPQLEPDLADGRGSSIARYALDQAPQSARNASPAASVEAEPDELGVGAVLGDGALVERA